MKRFFFFQIILTAFLMTGCVGSGGGLSGMDGNPGGGLGGVDGGQAQPTNEGVSDVEPGTPVECEDDPTHINCKELGLTAPNPQPPPPNPGADDLTL